MPTPPVVVHEFTVPIRDWPHDLAGLQIAHVSDFHFRRWNETLQHTQNLLAALDYDLLLVTGDFGNFRRHWRHAAEMTRRFFDPLVSHAPIYAVLGNHDNPQLPTVEDLPLTFLRNHTVRVRVRGGELNLAGIEQTERRGGDLDATLAATRPDAPTVLLTHYPSTAFRVPLGRVQVVLSGHTHGGQIRLPWLGCAWPNDRIPRRLAHGLHEVDGTKVHVSTGIGASPPLPVRINCPPELSLLTLVPVDAGYSPSSDTMARRKIRRPAVARV